MLIKPPPDIKPSEITDKETYASRRQFLKGAALVASAAGTAWLYRQIAMPGEASKAGEKIGGIVPSNQTSAPVINEPLTPLRDVTHYNNFYEFSTDKQAVAKRAMNFVTRPWTVQVGGLAHKPRTFDIDDLLRMNPPEERIYRHRCVEGWSMVIPWIGFPLAKLLEQVQPMGAARFVTFESLADPKRMPNVAFVGVGLAVRGGSAAGRSDAPFDHPGGRPLRRDPAAPERRPPPFGGALEIRLQGHQIHRPDQPGGEHAAHHLEPDDAQANMGSIQT